MFDFFFGDFNRIIIPEIQRNVRNTERPLKSCKDGIISLSLSLSLSLFTKVV